MAVLAGVAVAVPNDMMSAIPMHFEPNLGQTDARVRFSARGAGMSVYLTEAETVFARKSSEPVRMKLRGGRAAKFEPLERLPGVSNYYRGNDPKKWREGVPHYARVRAKSVYDGVDLVYYGNGRRLEYDFIVAPHTDPSKIELVYEGTESMRVDKDGALVLVTASGELRQRKPLVYQEAEGKRVEVAASYRIEGQAVRFELARYDAEKPLVIDPILEYGTYLGGDADESATAVFSDSTGVWVAGSTRSLNFPLMNPADSARSDYEGFVTKLNATGTALVFSTFLGGASLDLIAGMSVDGAGNAFVAGQTDSQDFPIAAAYQATYGGGGDAFAARLSPSGALAFSTFLGGALLDYCRQIVVTSTGVTLGCTSLSPNFLGDTIQGPSRPVLARLSLNGANLIFSKTLVGAAFFEALAADGSGAVYIAGYAGANGSLPVTQGAFQPANAGAEDAFVAKLNPAGDQWVYVTYLGGGGRDYGMAIAADAAGQAWVTGITNSSNFPIRHAYQSALAPGAYCCASDAFLTVLNVTGTALVFSTYFGGSGGDVGTKLALLPNGGVVIGGTTGSPDFPIVAGWRSETGNTVSETFFAKFTSSGALAYCSYLEPGISPSLQALAPGPAGSVYVAGGISPGGNASSLVTPGAYDKESSGVEAFVARFADGPPPVHVTVTSNPVGRQVIVDGRTVSTPAAFSWQPGTPHSLNASAAQIEGQTYFAFSNWAHGGASIQFITAPAAATTYTVNYSGTPCAYSFTPSTFIVGSNGISAPAQLTTQSLCKWTPQSSAAWLAPESASFERAGSSTLNFTAAVNSGGPRSATITAGNATLTVSQSGSQAGFPAPAMTAPLSGQTIQTKGVNLVWGPVAGASGYEIRILESSCCSTIGGTLAYLGRQVGVNATSTTIDMPDGSFTAYVRACGTGGFGDANCGSYGLLPFTVNLLAPVQSPVILTPVPGQTLRSSTNPISWQALPGATSYEVTLVNLVTGQTELSINTATLSTVFTMKSSAQYRLTLRGCQFKCGPSSSVDFSVQLPALSQSPPTGLTAQIANGNTLNLSWNAVTGADLYRIQVVQSGAGPGGGALTVAARQVSATNVSMPVPAGAATVVLNACNGDGCGPASTIAINPAGPNPSAPVVASPMPVVVADGPNITISWSRIPGDNGSNTDYRLYVGDLSRDGPALDVMTKNNFYGAFLRAEGRRYDALVFATQNGTTVTGPASGFMVAGVSAAASLITSPTHNSTFRQGPFRLAWAPIPDAVRYQYYVAREGRQSPDLTGMTPGLFVDTSLSVNANTTYNAIVRACPSINSSQCSPDSDAGWGPWSNAVTGTTRFTVVP